MMIHIKEGIDITGDEIRVTYSRSSGPGGQNVNKVNTKAAVQFDVKNSPSLPDGERERILRRLSSRISTEGVLRVESSRYRTQKANREAAVGRLVELLREALKRRTRRRRTKVPRSVRERRLESKKHRGERKASRRKVEY